MTFATIAYTCPVALGRTNQDAAVLAGSLPFGGELDMINLSVASVIRDTTYPVMGGTKVRRLITLLLSTAYDTDWGTPETAFRNLYTRQVQTLTGSDVVASEPVIFQAPPEFLAIDSWWRAGDLTVPPAGPVAQLGSISGVVARLMLQGAGPAQFGFVAADPDFGNRPVLSDPDLLRDLETAVGAVRAQPFSQYVLASFDNLAAAPTQLALAGGPTGSSAAIGFDAAGPATVATTDGVTILSAPPPTEGSPTLFGADFEGASSRLWLNDQPTSGAAGAGSSDRFQLGAAIGVVVPMQGRIAEALVGAQRFTDQQWLQIRNYVRGWYGFGL